MDDALDLSEQSIRSQGLMFALIIGEVSLWGTVVVGQRGYRAQFAYARRVWVVPDGYNRERESDEGVVDGLEHYGIELPGRDTTPHPISSLLWRLTNQRDGFDLNRRDAMITAAQGPGVYFLSFAGARARVLDVRAGILYGEQSADSILTVGTWEPSGYISRHDMQMMVYSVRATREPWPPSMK